MQNIKLSSKIFNTLKYSVPGNFNAIKHFLEIWKPMQSLHAWVFSAFQIKQKYKMPWMKSTHIQWLSHWFLYISSKNSFHNLWLLLLIHAQASFLHFYLSWLDFKIPIYNFLSLSVRCKYSFRSLYMLNHNILALAVPINKHLETTKKPVINNHTWKIQISWSNLEIYIYNHKLEFTTVKMVLYNSSVLLMLCTGN